MAGEKPFRRNMDVDQLFVQGLDVCRQLSYFFSVGATGSSGRAAHSVQPAS